MDDALAARTADKPLLSGQALRILTDEKLAAMVAAGSDEAFATLYRRYHQPIYRYCLSLLRHEADARDSLQSSMVAALSSLQARPIEGAFKPWLFRIAHNQSISIIRRRAKEAPTEAPPPTAVTDDPETREQLRVLVSDLSALPDRQRGAIVMRELSGLSYTEIGAALGTSQAAGKQLVYEARRALQDLREGHEMSCELVRERVSARDRRLLRGRKVRAHLRGCQPCQDFEQAIRRRRSAFALIAPPLSPLVAAAVLRDVFGGGGAGGGAGGAIGVASGGVPVAAGPVALKVAAAVLLTGAAGVGAYEAGTSIFGEDGDSAAAAAIERTALAGQARSHKGEAAGGHIGRAASARAGAGHARAPGLGQDGRPAGAGDAAMGSGAEIPEAANVASPVGHAPDAAGAGESEGAATAASNPDETAPSGGESDGVGPPGGGGPPSGGEPPTPPPPDPPPPGGSQVPPGTPPPGTPPGHGGTPPGQGGTPPGLVPGGPPPGQIGNPGHGGH